MRLSCFALAISAWTLSQSALAQDAGSHELTAQIDVRAVAVDSPLDSFAEGGTGQLRFGRDDDGIRLGSVMIDAAGELIETVRYNVTARATGDGDQNPIDLTEAYLEWRPYPSNWLRWKTRVGAFYAPISLENRTVGWDSLYSISSSAINTWLGEELRTIGLETSLTALGATAGRNFDVSVVGSVYAWNDPAGILLFQRGWGIHDRQTALFGELPRPIVMNPSIPNIEFFDEVDHRMGYYAGLEAKISGRHVLRALHYDNRGDTSKRHAREPTWLTRFDALGARLELPHAITAISQYMRGDTAVGPSVDGRGLIIVDFDSWFVLLSQQYGPHRITARYDRMETETVRNARFFDSNQDADAWTAAYLFDLNDHCQLAAEAIQLSGSLRQRAEVGLPASATERLLQLAFRYKY
ncbi:hypothetical protein [Peristeroidobacter soli]|uniref:hypothetical protein n=1 Tax=Peristeroidobacter soli TaxID=2497877 RepID=UPI00101C2839|nr:hypothetical protein [Peristeroidobacter soli]